MAALGVPYAVGREAREPLRRDAGPAASRRRGRASTTSRCCCRRSTRTARCSRSSASRSWTSAAGRVDGLGEGDGGLQAYGFRVCLTDRDENRLPIEQPRGYDPGAFELLRRYLEAAATGSTRARPARPRSRPAPERQVRRQLDRARSRSTCWTAATATIPTATTRPRARSATHHLRYTHALLYFLADDDGVPRRVRDEVGRWGLCADEFADTGGWPHQLYVRDGRRMLGEYVLREDDLLRRPRAAGHRRARAPTTSTSARSSARGATCPSTSAPRPSSTRDISRSPCRRTRSRTARSSLDARTRRICSSPSASPRRTWRSALCGRSRH